MRDVRVETFMRDIASDRGQRPEAVAHATTLRLAVVAEALRREAGPINAAQRQRAFFGALDDRIRDERDRYAGTGAEAHYGLVLAALIAFMRASAPERLVA